MQNIIWKRVGYEEGRAIRLSRKAEDGGEEGRRTHQDGFMKERTIYCYRG